MASGYNIYRGVGGISNVDFTTVLATPAVGNTTPSLVGLGHAVSTRYTYVVRPFLDDIETPDFSAAIEFVTDGAGDWLGARPGPPEYVTVEALSGAQIKISWTYTTGAVAAARFGVYHSTTVPITLGSPQATPAFTRDGRYSHTFTLSDGVTYFVTVTAQTAAGAIESIAPNTAGPVVGDSAAPTQPTAIVTSVF